MSPRDVADGNLVSWIDRQLHEANDSPGRDRLARMRASLVEPLRDVYGLSDKVLTMALSCISLGAPKRMSLWIEVGGSMIAIDTLVHNFLHRTGILHRFDANHAYGWLAIGLAAAPTLFRPLPNRSMPGSSTRHFQRPSRGLFNTRSGNTAARVVLMFAMETGSRIPVVAKIRIVVCG